MNNKNKKYLILVVILLVISAASVIYFKKNSLLDTNKTNSNVPDVKVLKYSNNKLGTEFNYPEKIYGQEVEIVQIKNNLAIISKNSELTKGDRISALENQSDEEIFRSLQSSSPADKVFFHIIVEDDVKEGDLTNFVKKWFYGEVGDCSKVESVAKSGQDDTYNVFVKSFTGDDLSKIKSDECLTNFGYHIKYSYNKQKVAYWNSGQDSISDMDLGTYSCNGIRNCSLDDLIPDSFKFIK